MSKRKLQLSSFSGQTLFKAQQLNQDGLRVDHEKGIVYGVLLARKGAARGHGTICEEPFLKTVVETGNRETGLKCRFGHPSMSEETLGTYTGDLFNLRLEKNDTEVRADMHLDKEALAKSPKFDKDPYGWILYMADKKPDKLAFSVVTLGNRLHTKDEDGKYVEITSEEQFDKAILSGADIYETCKSCDACDFVEDGALTEGGMFDMGAQFNAKKIGPAVTNFLSANPEIDSFIKANPEKIGEFMSKRYGLDITLKKQSKSLFAQVRDTISELFGNHPEFSTLNIEEMAKNKPEDSQFDITATTADGNNITIVGTGAEGDSVTLTDSGDAAPEGDHVIETSSDEEALPVGSTVAVSAEGTVSSVTAPEEEEDAPPAEDAAAPDESMKSLQKKFSALEKKLTALEKKSTVLEAENIRLKGSKGATQGLGDRRPSNSPKKQLSKHQQAANELSEKANRPSSWDLMDKI